MKKYMNNIIRYIAVLCLAAPLFCSCQNSLYHSLTAEHLHICTKVRRVISACYGNSYNITYVCNASLECFGVFLMRTAHQLARFLFAFLGNGAGVYNYQIGLLPFCCGRMMEILD